MDIQVIYFGNDRSFNTALLETCQVLKVPYGNIFPGETEIVSPSSDHIAIVDESLLNGNSGFLPDICRESNLFLIAVSNQSQELPPLPEAINPESVEVLTKTENQPLLKKMLALYLEHLEYKMVADPQVNVHELIKKNHRLTHQVIRLQEQLNQVDSNLHNHEKVIEAINHISQLSRQINCLDADKIATVCIDQIPQLISARFASLYTYNTEKGLLHLLRHNHPYTIARVVVLPEQPNLPMTIAVKQKKLLLIKDFTEWEKTEDSIINRMFSRNYETNSCIIAPLVSGDKILGVLNLADKIGRPCFDSGIDLPPVQLLCEIIGSAMSNIELYEEVQKRAQSDSMTNLLNHRAFYNLLDKEVQRARRYGNNLSLLMLDLDGLKETNDTYGHRAGDAVLIHVADKICDCIRDIDVAARYGGDEFSIILPNTSVSDAVHVAERMVNLISEDPVVFDGHKLYVSVSIGLGQYRSDMTVEAFMQESDAAMFDAKQAGKNRVHVF
ncbi:MAG: sensor domain-containing diguanylate cyclase [Sedimentisphaerales bacterium]|nr:sensor domain-containing diguanylate cyclase [Sedimentisphaerales bacterium]